MVVRKLLTQIIEFQFRPMSTMEVFKTLHSEPLRLTCSKHSSTKFPTIPMPVIDLFDDKPYTEDDDCKCFEKPQNEIFKIICCFCFSCL